MREATSVRDLNATLRGVLAGIFVEYEKPRRRLLAEFELRVPNDDRLPDGQTPMFRRRPSLPPATSPLIETPAGMMKRDLTHS